MVQEPPGGKKLGESPEFGKIILYSLAFSWYTHFHSDR